MAFGRKRELSTSSPARNFRSAGEFRSAAAIAARPWPTGECMSPTGRSSRARSNGSIALTGRPATVCGPIAYDCPYKNIGYTAGPRASVSIDDDRVYALGTMGHLHCLDAASGKLLWKKQPGVDYKIRMPIWGIAAAPLVDGELVIVQIGGEDGACLMAFDKKTGVEKWRALDDQASYSAPIIIRQAGRRVLVCWTGDNVAGLDPASGKVYWKYPFPPIADGHQRPHAGRRGGPAFLTSFYDGSLMLKLRQDEAQVEKIWRRQGASERHTDALHAMISTPYMEGDYVYGVDSYGELRCLDARNGDRIWEDLTAVPKARWATIHMVRNGSECGCSTSAANCSSASFRPKDFTKSAAPS